MRPRTVLIRQKEADYGRTKTSSLQFSREKLLLKHSAVNRDTIQILIFSDINFQPENKGTEDMRRNHDGHRENNFWVEILEKDRTEKNDT